MSTCEVNDESSVHFDLCGSVNRHLLGAPGPTDPKKHIHTTIEPPGLQERPSLADLIANRTQPPTMATVACADLSGSGSVIILPSTVKC